MDVFLCQALKEEFLAVKDDLALFWVMEGLVRFPALLEADSCGSFWQNTFVRIGILGDESHKKTL